MLNDIGKRRDESFINILKNLNKYVQMNYIKEKNINTLNDEPSWNYNVVFVIEILPEKEIIQMDNVARKNKICFIYTVKFELCSYVFIDFTRSLPYKMRITLKRDNFMWKHRKK